MPYTFAYPELPILARKDDILKALRENQTLVVQGGTGSGKTTQLPKFLLEAGLGESDLDAVPDSTATVALPPWPTSGLIGVTQPRRIAALTIADRLRQETGRPELIGAKIRFHEDVPEGCRVKVMTDGILLQEFRRDPLLRRYAGIVLDEAHERSLNVDILLGIFKQLLPRRPEFRLIVTSATLDADRFAAYLGAPLGGGLPDAPPYGARSGGAPSPGAPSAGSSKAAPEPKAPVIEVEGRQFPVHLEYWDISGKEAAEEGDEGAEGVPARAFPPVEAAAIAIRELQGRKRDNLLAFLPTEKEINELQRELEKDLGRDFLILPLYSRLAPGDQKRVFEESDRPKIILATNIAETSLTIPGIGYVVDTGLARVARYHAQTKIQGLPIERVSQASARQRAGRAGRVKPGTCVRLYSEADFNERPTFTEPEVLRSNLANVALQLLALGLDVGSFPFPDPPAPAILKGAFRQLHELGAVDGPGLDARLTPEGRRMSKLPVDVALGKILLKAADYNVLELAVVVAAGITVQDPRFLPREEPDRGKAAGLHKRFEDPRSDFLGVLALWIWIHRNWGERWTQRKLRVLCAESFLSYNRVREWMDLADQFSRLLKIELDPAKLKLEEAATDGLHKAILAGFLAFLGRRKPEDTAYRLAGDKEAHIHPGSALAKRRPEWIVAGEVRQTSRTFIYRAAEIKPAWVEEVAPEMCKKAYGNVAWNPERGFVEAVERITFKGFALRQDRRVNYEAVAPEECAEIFWREGVIRGGAGAPLPFREANQRVLASLAALETKARMRGLVPDEDALAHWYRSRAPEVASRIGLERFLKAAPERILEFGHRDWAGGLEGGEWNAWDEAAGGDGAEKTARPDHVLHRLYPDRLTHAGHTYRLSYRFDYGDPQDGIALETDAAGLAALTIPALLRGLRGWRKWIWDYALERLGAKAAEAARPRAAHLAAAWDRLAADWSQAPGEASPAAFLARALAAEDAIGAPSFPVTWPSYLQIHVFVTSPTGRRFLLHVDPSWGEADLFLAARKLLFGAAEKPWAEWLPGHLADWGGVAPPLPWRGFAFGPDPLGAASSRGTGGAQGSGGGSLGKASSGGSAGKSPPACGWFASIAEAAFQHRLAAEIIPAGSSALPGFFAKRLQALLDAWSVPPEARAATATAREFLAGRILSRYWQEAFGADALARAEKDLPPPRPPVLAKAGSQVKSLAALGQAVHKGGGSNGWAGAALVLGAGFVSRECFTAWFRVFTQPSAEAKQAVADLLARASALPDWDALLVSPFAAARFAEAWASALPGADPISARDRPPASAGAVALAEAEAARDRAEAVRKGAKALRDRICARLAGLGQSVAGLPKEPRAALDALDQNLPWPRKLEAQMELEAMLLRQNAKAGPAKAAAGGTGASGPEAAAQGLARPDQILKNLSGRFKKL
ncbi:MAG: ATP-dependent RNA helicase HrpA [Fibrobacteres bacterium]|nr:ATP-dependent RNA helicase HrpA [Fibrobacterota bacterium]